MIIVLNTQVSASAGLRARVFQSVTSRNINIADASEPVEPIRAGQSRFTRTVTVGPITAQIGSMPSANSESLNQLPPPFGLGLRVRARDQQAKGSFSKHMHLKGCGWLQKVGLDIWRQPQKVHNLGNACSRYPFAGGDFGSGKPRITIKLLSPRTCQKKSVSSRLVSPRRFFIGASRLILNTGGKRNRAKDERLGTPSRERDSHRQFQLPASSAFTLASGATPSS